MEDHEMKEKSFFNISKENKQKLSNSNIFSSNDRMKIVKRFRNERKFFE